LYQKVKDVDSHAILYPWIAGDLPHSNSVISHPDAFPTHYSIWKQYAHNLLNYQMGVLTMGKFTWD